ncbi:hypothetical protein FHS60_002087 [Alloprevotella rava]|uniref:Uncharacterized protein n=1 Tax=Alloprevotella rava TaxID=671218 RepID=A0A7W5ULM0_9BACT|nr:hypothetical protein [Alloprevotella rava]
MVLLMSCMQIYRFYGYKDTVETKNNYIVFLVFLGDLQYFNKYIKECANFC